MAEKMKLKAGDYLRQMEKGRVYGGQAKAEAKAKARVSGEEEAGYQKGFEDQVTANYNSGLTHPPSIAASLDMSSTPENISHVLQVLKRNNMKPGKWGLKSMQTGKQEVED